VTLPHFLSLEKRRLSEGTDPVRAAALRGMMSTTLCAPRDASTPTASYAADYIKPGTSSDIPIEGTSCVKGGMSIKAFDMSTLEFQDIWDPSLVDYEVPQAVIDIIGGE
jgi:hypothetical protein